MAIITNQKQGWRYWRNLGLFAVICSVIGFCFLQFVAYPFITAYGYSHPKRLPVCCKTPSDIGLDYEDVAVTTIDNLTLRGWYVPSQNGAAIILLHSLASNRIGTLDGAKMLAKHGYGILMLDLRAHGESDGNVFPYGGPEAEDLSAAISYLQIQPEIDPKRIGVMGWSLGAQVSILAAARFPEIKAVVADGPGATAFEDWPPPRTFGEWLFIPIDFVSYQVMPLYTDVNTSVSIREAISEISPRPVLLISADFETEKYRMEYFMNAAKEPKSLWVIPETDHIEGITKYPQEYEKMIVDFFDEAFFEEKH